MTCILILFWQRLEKNIPPLAREHSDCTYYPGLDWAQHVKEISLIRTQNVSYLASLEDIRFRYAAWG